MEKLKHRRIKIQEREGLCNIQGDRSMGLKTAKKVSAIYSIYIIFPSNNKSEPNLADIPRFLKLIMY